jgi:hypothetical protein
VSDIAHPTTADFPKEDFPNRSLGMILAAIRKMMPIYILLAIIGLIPLIVVGWSTPSGAARVVGVGAMVGAAAYIAGALIGFLFGIPRVLQRGVEPSHDADGASRSGYLVNTNLEQISDWLTKILVGVGLTQLPAIADACGRLIAAVADGMGSDPAMTSLAGAVLTYFLGAGFLQTYFIARTTLTLSFRLSDAELSPAEVVDIRNLMRSTDEAASQRGQHLTEEPAREVQGSQQGTGGPAEDLKRPTDIESNTPDSVHVHEERLPRQSRRG